MEEILTGNCDLNSVEQGNHNVNCSLLNQTIHTSEHNEQCIRQTGGQFGFISKTDLKLYEGEPIHWETIPDVMQAHYVIKNSELLNYLKCRFPVNTNLNIKN